MNFVIDMDTLILVKLKGGIEAAKALDGLMGIPCVDGALELTGASDLLLRISSDSLSASKAAIDAVKAHEAVESAGTYLVIGERKWRR